MWWLTRLTCATQQIARAVQAKKDQCFYTRAGKRWHTSTNAAQSNNTCCALGSTVLDTHFLIQFDNNHLLHAAVQAKKEREDARLDQKPGHSHTHFTAANKAGYKRFLTLDRKARPCSMLRTVELRVCC